MVACSVSPLYTLCCIAAAASFAAGQQSVFTAPSLASRQPSPLPVILPPIGASPYQLLLSLEAGAFKGLLQVEVLIGLRDAIKQIMVERGYVPAGMNASMFDVDLMHFFHHTAGTSAGALQTFYLASRGGTAAAKTLVQSLGIRPGTPEALRAVFQVLAQQDVGFSSSLSQSDSNDALLQRAANATASFLSGVKLMVGNLTLAAGGNTSLYITTTDPIRRRGVDFFYIPDAAGPLNAESISGWAQYEYDSSKAGPNPPMQAYENVDFSAADVLTASCAAVPVLLPHRVKSLPTSTGVSLDRLLVDGAYTASNPTAVALAFLLRRHRPEQLAVVSVGNGDAIKDFQTQESLFKAMLKPTATGNLAFESGLQKLSHVLAEALLQQDHQKQKVSRMLRLDVFLEEVMRDLNTTTGASIIPGVDAQDLLTAMDTGFADSIDAYEAIGTFLRERTQTVMLDFVRAYVLPEPGLIIGVPLANVDETNGGNGDQRG